MKIKKIYIAFDDKEFPSEEACKAYEEQHAGAKLVGLTLEQVQAALANPGTDALANAIEGIGQQIKQARIAAGVLRRQPSVKTPPVTGPSTAPPASQEAA